MKKKILFKFIPIKSFEIDIIHPCFLKSHKHKKFRQVLSKLLAASSSLENICLSVLGIPIWWAVLKTLFFINKMANFNEIYTKYETMYGIQNIRNKEWICMQNEWDTSLTCMEEDFHTRKLLIAWWNVLFWLKCRLGTFIKLPDTLTWRKETQVHNTCYIDYLMISNTYQGI